ncbi:hypothetical protein [Phormidium sp. CCY1219]|uniref:hypothetical protein n=1 Tax=Phormidium sp. CCY1219 TaxID=2886104 RepID=UPI002D1F924C|nr:hypothetical protein [Phormidium sp. CCY1219]MEB3831807.1 hypothetical protein [Phormidium sp. CCY1219]
MGRGRPGGNPELEKFQFQKGDRPESLKSKLSIWIEPSMVEALKQNDNWRDEVRRAIAQIVKQRGQLSEELREYYGIEN